jgi:hypothetical protein
MASFRCLQKKLLLSQQKSLNLGTSNPSVTGSRSRPRRSTYSVLAFQRRGFTGEPNQPLDFDGRWFARDCEEVVRHRIRH